LVGFSDGGEYELIMAGLEPTAAKSLLTWGACGQIAAPPPMYDAMEHLIDHAERPMQGFAEYLKATYGEANARVMTQTFGRALRAINAAGGDVSLSLAPKVTCPALLITGEHDFLAPPALVSTIASTIPGAEFVEAKGASHQVHAEQPEWLVRTITEWLGKH
jgi:3-oxoadipate enol-lactonase